MRPPFTRSRLSAGKAVRIACLYYPSAMMPAQAAEAGFVALWLDAKHNTWDRRELQRLIALRHLANIDCIVRTGSGNPTELYHLLEDGATALMIPLVKTGAKAAIIASAVKFPPSGNRGLDGAGLDNNFYLQGTDGYPGRANTETFLILQIESPEALENLDLIAGTPGVDSLFFGPGASGAVSANLLGGAARGGKACRLVRGKTGSGNPGAVVLWTPEPDEIPLRMIVPVLLVACTLTCGGCFKVMRKMGAAWCGGSTREEVMTAAVADVPAFGDRAGSLSTTDRGARSGDRALTSGSHHVWNLRESENTARTPRGAGTEAAPVQRGVVTGEARDFSAAAG